MAAICSVVRPGAVVLLTLIVAFALLVGMATNIIASHYTKPS